MSKLLIEQYLPAHFFEELGRYVATCGHIEETAWRIIVLSHRLDLSENDDLRRVKKIRDNAGQLVDGLKAASAQHPEPIRSTILDLAARMSRDERGPRNMAVHGAWAWSRDAGAYGVCSSAALADALANDRPPAPEPVTQDQVDNALRYVDGLLRRLRATEDQIIALDQRSTTSSSLPPAATSND